MKRTLVFALLACAGIACTQPSDPLEYVDPFIGTGFHGHTFPGAATPFGMVQLSPDTRSGDWDACAGYHYDDRTIDGFSHTHLSGTGCADLADILFHPTTREEVVRDGAFLEQPYAFSHDRETASCGYYSVELPDEGLTVELTAAPRTGVHRYTFHGDGPRRVIVDLMHTITDERVDLRALRQEGASELSGMRRTQGWAADHQVWFWARFSEPFASVELLGDRQAVLTFAPGTTSLTAAVGLSAVSAENARENALEEVPELDFDAVRARAEELWREALGRIVVEGGTREERTIFYTAQYHACLTPNLMNDVNGQYRRNDQSVATLPAGRRHYSTLSLWDTFRAWNPLQTLVDTTLVRDMACSMLDMYDATGELPIWPLASGETRTMIGYHAASVIADAWMKGIRGYDGMQALEAMVRSSNINAKGSDDYVANGFIPSENTRESVSCTLEYAYDDWVIYDAARKAGDTALAEEYRQRALNYRNVFDPETGFARGRMSDGSWKPDPNLYDTHGQGFIEGNSWNYSMYVPHDPDGLIGLMGGDRQFVARLDSLFTEYLPDRYFAQTEDVTREGLLGMYVHGNEPSHHVPYLYMWTSQPWKTQYWVREIMDRMYRPVIDGLCGNDDCGQMSAWYIFTAMGFYPVCPGSDQYVLGAPYFPYMKVRVGEGRYLEIKAPKVSSKNRYVHGVRLNGKPWTKAYLTYSDLCGGGVLEFDMRPTPDKRRRFTGDERPYSLSREL